MHKISNAKVLFSPQELARYSEHLEISTPSRLRSFPKGTSIVHCSSGGWSFHALDSKGRVWFWGTLDGSGWAAPGQPLSNPFKTQTTPTLLEAEFDRHKIVQLESGRSHAAALDSVGHVFEWRCWGRVARVRDAERRWATAKRINAGWDFTLLLVDGDSAALTYHRPQIYIFWQARQSEISRAALSQPVISSEGYEHPTVTFDFDVNSLKLPDPPFDQDEKVLQMAAGDKHAFILSSRGRVYMIDISPVPVPVRQAVRPQPPQLPQLPQVHEEAEGMRPSERERLSAAFMSGERSWKYLENFCDASRLQQRPELNGLDLSNLHMNHISAHFQNFTVYDTALGVVLLGSLVEQSEELRPLIKPELQGRDIIK